MGEEAEDVEMKPKESDNLAALDNESPEPAKKTVCKFISNSCSKKSKGSPSECKSHRS